MLKEGMTILDAAQRWVGQFNAIPTGMVEKLMRQSRDEWREITLPSRADRVYVNKFPPQGCKRYGEGELVKVFRDKDVYQIRLDDGRVIEAAGQDVEPMYDDIVPMWGTMWSFGERMDDDWLMAPGALRAMSDCGFRIFESDEFGYFFGIDGAGYDFYEQHWEPLYRARGLEWHDPKAEKERQMQNKGYHRGKLGGKAVWLDNQNNVVEEVH